MLLIDAMDLYLKWYALPVARKPLFLLMIYARECLKIES